MGWQIQLDDGTVLDVGKLKDEFFEEQSKSEGVDYWDVYNQHPAANIGRFRAILTACCARAGVDPPTFEDMDAWVRFTNEKVIPPGAPIEEKPMVDGFPPTPGELEVGSTSGSPGGTDGPPTSSKNKP